MIRTWMAMLATALSNVRAAIRRFAGVQEEETFEPARVYWDEGVALTLTDLVHEAETRASGRVQVITLGEFRAAVGELWDKYAPRVLLIAETTISRMIGKGNTFIAQDRDTWLLLFPALSEPDALKRADAIAARIGEKLVGAHFTESPPPLPEASKLDLSGALNADGSLNLERMRTAVENVRQATALGAGAAKAAIKKSPTSARPAAPAATIVPAKADLAAKSEFTQLSISFHPAWNAETQSLNSYFFRAAKLDGADVFAPGTPPPNDATVLDLLAAATRAFSEMCERGLRATFTIPIPLPALRGAALPEIQKLIARLPQQGRLVHLRIEITHVPARIGAESLVPIRELFRPYTRDVAFLLDLFAPADQVLALDHVVVGFELSRAARHGDDELFQAMLTFRQRAGRRQTYALGLSSRLQVAHAVTANIAEVGGSGVAADAKKLPDQVTVIRRQDLLL
ncbi:MAG: hypothetical protein IT566_12415 [Rhodospirillaceae bacterium]|nr:hypothetical protein [Rhodospirillaceae bacterium]